MYLTYFDDTGGTGQNYSDPQQRVQGICSVSIDEAIWRSVEQDCRSVVAKRFPNETGEYLISGSFELHAGDIYQGTRAFRGMGFSERLEVLLDIASVIVRHRLPIAGIYIEKARAPSIIDLYSQKAMPSVAIDDVLFTRLYLDLNLIASRSAGSKHAILIGDRASIPPKSIDKWIRHFNFRVAVPPIDPFSGRQLTHILGSLQFEDSHRSFGIQLADAAAYLIRRRISHPNKPNPATEHLFKGLDIQLEQAETDGMWRAYGGWVLDGIQESGGRAAP